MTCLDVIYISPELKELMIQEHSKILNQMSMLETERKEVVQKLRQTESMIGHIDALLMLPKAEQ